MRLLKKYKALIMQIIKFGIVGVTNTLVGLGVYYLCLLVVDYRIAYFVGFIVSVMNAYILSSRFVFKNNSADSQKTKPKTTVKKIAKVYASYGITSIIGFLFMSVLLVETLGVSEKIAPLFNLCLTVPLNFCMNKFWAFKNK